MRTLTILPLMVVLVAGQGSAAELECRANESLRDALDRTVNDAWIAAVESEVEEDVSDESTSGAAPDSAASLRDLLSFLVASLDLGDLSEEGKALVLELNPENLRLGTTGGLSIKTVLHDPELFEPLKEAVEEAGDAELLSALQDSVEDLDDLELLVTWDRESARFGRAPETARSLLAELHAGAIRATTTATGTIQRTLRVLAARAEEGLDMEVVACDSAPSDLRAALGDAAEETVAEQRQLRATLQGIQFHSVADLVSNQRQLYFTGSYRSRDPAIGRNEASLEGKYEHSFANYWKARELCSSGGVDWRFECLSGYLAEEDGKLKYAPRLTVNASYTWLDDYEPPEVAEATDLSFDEAERWSVAATFGTYLRLVENAEGTLVGDTRFDFEALWEDYTDDAAKRDRGVVTATLVQPLVEKLSATVGVVWASKPEYLAEFVEEGHDEVSARVGFKFIVDQEEDN